jgi:hypothetical protein
MRRSSRLAEPASKRVGDQEQQDDALKHNWWQCFLDIAGETLAGNSAIRAQINWIADISGTASGIVHSILRPNCAPACE